MELQRVRHDWATFTSLHFTSLKGASSKSRRLWDALLFHLRCKPGCKSPMVGPHGQTYTLSNFWFQITENLAKNGLETKVWRKTAAGLVLWLSNAREVAQQLWCFLTFLLVVTKWLQELKASNSRIISLKTDSTGVKSAFYLVLLSSFMREVLPRKPHLMFHDISLARMGRSHARLYTNH